MSNVPPPPPPGAAIPPPPAASSADAPPTAVAADARRRPAETIAAVGPSNLKIFGAEAVGTGVLMIVGPGSAILAVRRDRHLRRRLRLRARPAGDGLHDRPRLRLPHQPGGHAGLPR